ncbi:MAG: sensor domain-containing diguanylate cyclase, partial [Chitinophagaceae bacterium]
MSAAADAPWDDAPCGLVTLARDGTVLAANRVLWEWTGRAADDVVGKVPLSALLSVGGRIYWETHLAPLLEVEGRVDEVAVELRVRDGRLPVLLTAVVGGDRVHAAISSARDRMSYERELLAARVAAERASGQLQALQATTAALSRALGVAGVAQALLAAAVDQLGAAAATLWLADEEARLVVHGATGEPPAGLPSSGVLLRGESAAPDGGRTVVPLQGQS